MNYYRYAALALAGLLAACDGKPTPAATDPVVSNIAPADVAPAAEPVPVALGQVGSAPGADITITSVEQRSQIGSDGFGRKAGADEIYVVVRYSIKNTFSKPLPSDERPAVTLADGTGQTYADDGAAGLSVGGIGGAYEDLNPGTSAQAAAVWKVSKMSFDASNWKVVVGTDPQLRFALK